MPMVCQGIKKLVINNSSKSKAIKRNNYLRLRIKTTIITYNLILSVKMYCILFLRVV